MTAPIPASEIERLRNRRGDWTLNETKAACSLLTELLALRDENKRLRENGGALWTLIAKISEPIRRCFRDRTMPFADLQQTALEWEQSISGSGHPDVLRSRLEAAEAIVAKLPKTKDGVTVTLGMIVYKAVCPEGSTCGWTVPECGLMYAKNMNWDDVNVSKCYVSHEAALAASKGEKS